VHLYSVLYDPLDNAVQVVVEIESVYQNEDLVGIIRNGTGGEARLQPDSSSHFDFLVEDKWPILILRFSAISWMAGAVDMAIGLGESSLASFRSPFTPVELIEVSRNGLIGACVSPLFAHTPHLMDWIQYHVELGVNEVQMYVPHASFIDAENYTSVYGSAPLKGQRGRFRVQPFHSRYVAWRHYTPRPSSYYFGQLATYNDCIFRNRRRYDFIMLLDTDEFVVLQQPPLLSFLETFLTENYSNIRLPNFYTSVACPVQEDLQILEDFDIFVEPYPDASLLVVREGEEGGTANWNTGSKTIVRPLNVKATHTHGPVYLEEGKVKDFLIDAEIGGMRHVRCSSWS